MESTYVIQIYSNYYKKSTAINNKNHIKYLFYMMILGEL